MNTIKIYANKCDTTIRQLNVQFKNGEIFSISNSRMETESKIVLFPSLKYNKINEIL